MCVHEVLVNRLGSLSLPRKSVVRLTDHPDMTFDAYRGRKTTTADLSMADTSLQQSLLCFHIGAVEERFHWIFWNMHLSRLPVIDEDSLAYKTRFHLIFRVPA